MPKSRGRPPHRRKAATPRSTPTSWEAAAVRDCQHLLAADITRLDAELFASELLGEAVARRTPATRDATATAVADLTASATRRGTTLAAVLVAALATVRDDEALTEALDGWAAPFLTERPLSV